MRQIHYSAWLLVVLSAILQVIIFPLPGVYALSWFALAPLILALLRARPVGELEIAGSLRLRPATPGQGFVLGYACGILWYAGTCYWIYDTMRQYGGLSAPEALLARQPAEELSADRKRRRNLLEYVLFDPVIFRRPQWPRGIPLVDPSRFFFWRSPLAAAPIPK